MSKTRAMVKMSATVLLFGGTALADDARGGTDLALYTNDLTIRMPNGLEQTNCADPTVIRGKGPDPYWYAFCTTDSLNDEDVDERGVRRSHLLPSLRSRNLVDWEYRGDVFAAPPSWAAPGSSLWAPDVVYLNGKYHLYYVVTDTADSVSGEPGCTSDNAIGVATSSSPNGPWKDSGKPVVAPRRAGPGCNFYWTYDPDVLVPTRGEPVIYYGSYYGGIEARKLAADGLSSLPDSARAITIPNRYEGANVVEKDGKYYLFASASDCCNGPLTGYQVFAGRSSNPFGPFVDREGVSLLDTRVGGTPVLTLNGNKWVGVGHNSVFSDAAGNWYTAYHGIDRGDPYFQGNVGYTRRPLLLDRITWQDGWPEVRSGLGASDSPKLAPAPTPPRDPKGVAAKRALVNTLHDLLDPSSYLTRLDDTDVARLPLVTEASDEFDGEALASRWSWVRAPGGGAAGVSGGVFQFATQAGELFGGSNDAAVLIEDAPRGNWIVEAKVDLDLPDTGCCFNYVQAGLVVYANDDAYVKLTHVSIWETRQIEFAKEIPAPIPGFPAYGSGVGAAPGRTTWLRIARVVRGDKQMYVSYSSRDGKTFSRGPVWDHDLGATPKIGLVSFGGTGFTARFDHVRVRTLPNDL